MERRFMAVASYVVDAMPHKSITMKPIITRIDLYSVTLRRPRAARPSRRATAAQVGEADLLQLIDARYQVNPRSGGRSSFETRPAGALRMTQERAWPSSRSAR